MGELKERERERETMHGRLPRAVVAVGDLNGAELG